jgi:hydrogenase maturation protease
MPPRILIAGIGNIFMGDDAFGVEVARRLSRRRLPDGVRVVDFGIRGLDLAYAMLDDDIAILVDATPRGEPVGTLYVIELESNPTREPDPREMLIETHGMDPQKVLNLVAALGGRSQRVLLVGCEPAPLGPDEDAAMRLSEPVQAAVDEAVGLIESLVEEICEGKGAPVDE